MLLTPSRRLLIVGLCCAAVAWAAGSAGRFAVVLALLLFGPGYLIETLLRPAKTPTAFQRPALWLGLSLSIVALLYQWATFVGLALTLPILSMLAGGCGLGVVWCAWREGDATAPILAVEQPPAVVPQRRAIAAGLGLLAVFVLTLWTRFVEIQNLVLPAWVDSVHHTLMVRVAAESGKVPYSLRPYLPVDDMPYHWGYHVFTAAVLQLSSITLPQVVFWSGQVLNALHVLTCAALATYLWRRPLAGVVAGLVVGLISIMPAYYVSWGRYTQLTGLLILPPLMIAWHAGLRQASRRWLVIASVLLAGLSVTHFRVLVFALAFLAVASMLWAFSQPWSLLRKRLVYAIGIAGTSLLLAGPWLGLLAVRALRPVIERPQGLVSGGSYTALNEQLLWSGHNYWLVALALLAALWCLWQRTRSTIDIVGWTTAIVLLANPWLVGFVFPAFGALLVLWSLMNRRWLALLPGGVLLLINPMLVRLPYSWLITNDIVIISLFVPLSVLIGGGLSLFRDWLAVRLSLFWRALVVPSGAVALAGLALWGAGNLHGVINSATVFVTQADLAAINWVEANTPTDARFLINSAPWLPAANRGSDGGWWLLTLANRWISTPPVLYTYGEPDYVSWVQELNREVAGFQPGKEEELYRLIDREQITHIYTTTWSGPLKPATFANSNAFTKVYDRDGVAIFAVYDRAQAEEQQ